MVEFRALATYKLSYQDTCAPGNRFGPACGEGAMIGKHNFGDLFRNLILDRCLTPMFIAAGSDSDPLELTF